MRHRPNQPIDGSSWQPGVGIERDDVPDVARNLAHLAQTTRDSSRARVTRYKRGVRRSSEEAIQLVELPALALPPHPRLLALVPEPPTVEEKESLASTRNGTVASVQTRDPLARRGETLLVTRHALRGRIRPVGEKGETKITIRIRQVVHFQPLAQLVDLHAVGHEGGHDDHRPQCHVHAIAQLGATQHARREQPRDPSTRKLVPDGRSADGRQKRETYPPQR